MGETTGIAWCDATFNPWWGCAHVSPGCVNCYAETLAKRYGKDVWGKATDRRFFGDKHWNDPAIWNRKAEAAGVRRRVFCGSMMDVFEDRDDLFEDRLRLFDLIERTPSLDWLLLTKRPESVLIAIPSNWETKGWPLNVWLGVSVEDQRRADERIPKLLEVPAAVRFLSCEPLLGPVTFRWAKWQPWAPRPGVTDHLDGLRRLDWVIVGGESGPGRRPMHPEWTRSIWEECREADVAFFGKQGSGPKSDQQYQMPAEVFATRQWPDSPAAALVPEGRLL